MMKLILDVEMAEWLSQVEFASDSFQWDEGNRDKNLKHGVTQEDVEQLFKNDSVFVGRILEPAHDEERWLLLGTNQEGRKLTLVFTRRQDQIRPISCRSMRHDEVTHYEKEIKR